MTGRPVERIVLGERDTARVVELDDDHAALIRATGLLQVERAGPGWWRLAPHQRVDKVRVGAVRVGNVDVEIRPKIGIARLLFLLGYATDPAFRPADTAADIADGLWPALAETLIRHTERAFTHGLLPGYRTVQEPARSSAAGLWSPSRSTDAPALSRRLRCSTRT